jgi:catechol 2,3-dioxygenase-like lactoylglutathione lyase family enzyme
MLDHAGFGVSDYQRSRSFYESALAPLGMSLLMGATGKAAGFGREGKPFSRSRRPRGAGRTPHRVRSRGARDGQCASRGGP